jgi:hypothetical protein
VRQSYNIAPGYLEPVYRAEVPERPVADADTDTATTTTATATTTTTTTTTTTPRYIIQPMKWGAQEFPFAPQSTPERLVLSKASNQQA